jgi:hypothetical protein
LFIGQSNIFKYFLLQAFVFLRKKSRKYNPDNPAMKFNKKIKTFKTKEENMRYFFYKIFIAVMINISAQADVKSNSSKTVFQDSFERQSIDKAWLKNNKKIKPETLVDISNKAAFDGKQALLLYDNAPKLSTSIDYAGEFPRNGSISGYLMFPKNFRGIKNSNRAYTSIQLFGSERGSLPILISIQASTRNATTSIQKNGKKIKIVLPDVVNFDAWIPWRIAWQSDDNSSEGSCRIAVGNKETDKLTYSANKISRLRLVSGWSSIINNCVYYDLIRIKSGNPVSRYTNQKTTGFTAKKIKTVFADTFNNADDNDPKFPAGWSHWQPASDNGKAIYDRSYGKNDSDSLCFVNSMRCWWQRKNTVTPGKTYRLSGWLKTSQASKGEVGLHIIPKVISKDTGKEIFLAKHGSVNEIKIAPGFWNYLEVFWTAPESDNYSEGKLVGIDIASFSKNLNGKAWCDDITLDEVIIEKPFRENFLEKTSVLKKWQIYSHPGLEGVAKISYAPSGFADKGAIEVIHVKGKIGPFSAATTIDREILGAESKWTLLAHSKTQGKGKPSVNIQQLDEDGKIILETSKVPVKKTDAGWEKQQITFSLLDNTKKVELLLTNSGQDCVTFDNVWLRPANAHEKAEFSKEKKFSVWMNVFPADAFAIIDNMPAVLKFSHGQTNAFCIQLAGDNTPKETTTVDIEMPECLALQTAQIAVYGKQSLKYEKIKSEKDDRITYRFKNPYDWQRAMVRSKPNPYHGLLVVVKPTGEAGTKDYITVKTSLGKTKGEERKIDFTIGKALPSAAKLKIFKVGLWNTQWLNLRDSSALKEIYKTYIDAGIKIGSMHRTHEFANEPLENIGFIPAKVVHGPDMPHSYSSLPKQKRPDMMTLVNGKTSSHHIALGLALNDPATNKAYKKYLIDSLKVLPKYSPYVISDIELWGDGCSNRSCFHPSTIAAFRKYAGIPESTKLNAEIILKKYYEKWSDFRNWLTAELHGLMLRYIHDIRPDLKLLAYDYPLAKDGKPQPFVLNAPMNTLLYDPNIDIHLISYYNYEGTRFLNSVDNDVKHLKKPVWAVPYIVDNINAISSSNWHYHHPSAKELRMEIVGGAASGAKGFFPFSGYLLGSDRLQAYTEGVNAVAKYEDFYMNGKRADKKVLMIKPYRNARYRVHELNGKLLLTLFNCSNKELKIFFEFNGKQEAIPVKAHDFKQIKLK